MLLFDLSIQLAKHAVRLSRLLVNLLHELGVAVDPKHFVNPFKPVVRHVLLAMLGKVDRNVALVSEFLGKFLVRTILTSKVTVGEVQVVHDTSVVLLKEPPDVLVNRVLFVRRAASSVQLFSLREVETRVDKSDSVQILSELLVPANKVRVPIQVAVRKIVALGSLALTGKNNDVDVVIHELLSQSVAIDSSETLHVACEVAGTSSHQHLACNYLRVRVIIRNNLFSLFFISSHFLQALFKKQEVGLFKLRERIHLAFLEQVYLSLQEERISFFRLLRPVQLGFL